MKITKQNLNKLIQEAINERTFPDTFKVDPDGETFSVDAEPNKKGEEGDRRSIKGKIVPHKGKFLAKAADDEDYFGAGKRSASGQLSAQLGDTLSQSMDNLGLDAETAAAATARVSKGDVMAGALQQLIGLEAKLRSKRDKEALRSAVNSLLGIKYTFGVPDVEGFGGESDDAEESINEDIWMQIAGIDQ